MWKPDTLVALATKVSQEHGLNTDQFTHVIGCESSWVPDAKGDDGNSRGLVQISSIYHPEVTDAEADNPTFALEWMAKQWDAGHEREWSCYRKLY